MNLSPAVSAPVTLPVRPRHRLVGSSLGSVLCQYKSDMLGKEVQTGFTVSYAWFADQGGHILIGVLGSVTFGGIVRLVWADAPIRLAIAPSLLLLALIVWKEARDYRKDANWENPQGLFKIDASMLLWNAVTATLIMLFGVGIGIAVLISFRLGALAAFAALLATAGFAWWWIPQKVAFQSAGLPFVFRLGNVSAALKVLRRTGADPAAWALVNAAPEDGQRLAAFATPNGECGTLRHLIVVGTLDAGKTSFGVALATEFAMARGYARYLSFARLLEGRDDIHDDEPVPHQGRILWRWPHCDFVVVDDVDVAIGARLGRRGPARTEGQLVANALQEKLTPEEARALGAARTVWLICDDKDEKDWLDTLGGFLASIPPPTAGGVSEVMVVRLDPGAKTFHPKPCFK